MNGLIQQNMAPEQPAMSEGPMEAEAPEDMQAEGAEEGDSPEIIRAMTLAMTVLYEQGAANKVLESLRSAPDKIEGLTDTAYNMTGIVDEQTNGEVPDEQVFILAIQVMTEIAEIAEAGGMPYKPSELSKALQKMTLRYLSDSGVDPSQMEQAMSKFDDNVLDQAAAADTEA